MKGRSKDQGQGLLTTRSKGEGRRDVVVVVGWYAKHRVAVPQALPQT